MYDNAGGKRLNLMQHDGLKYAVLGSGSSANSYIFEFNDFAFIIDNGFSCKQAMERAAALGFDTSKVKYIFLTHDHGDHFRGIEILSRKLRAPVVVHKELDLRRKVKTHLYKRVDIEPGNEYTEGDFTYRAFRTSHDAEHSVSYHFRLGPAVFTIITDTGAFSREMFDYACVSDVLFLEANYNEQMLIDGPYHHALKQRILSELGHLSNEDALNFLNSIEKNPESRLKEVYFCHLSSTNNHPDILAKDIAAGLNWSGQWVICRKGEIQRAL